MACGTSNGSWTGASGANQTPSGKPRATSAAALTANRVLPTPPLPVSVSRRVVVSSRLTSCSSWRRPTKLVGSTGSFGVRALAAGVFTTDHPTPRLSRLGSGRLERGLDAQERGQGRLVHRLDEFQADAGEEREQAPLTRHEG